MADEVIADGSRGLRSGHSSTIRRWVADLAARGAEGRWFRGRYLLGRCRSRGRVSGRVSFRSRGRAGGGHPFS